MNEEFDELEELYKKMARLHRSMIPRLVIMWLLVLVVLFGLIIIALRTGDL